MCTEECDFFPDPEFRKAAGIAHVPYDVMLKHFAEAPLSAWTPDDNDEPPDWRASIKIARTDDDPDRWWICHDCYPIRLLINKIQHGRMDD